MLFESSSNTRGITLIGKDSDRSQAGDAKPPAGVGEFEDTAQSGRLLPLESLSAEERATESEVRTLAEIISRRIAVREPPLDSRSSSQSGKLHSVRFTGRSDDIDLDRTIEVLAERPVPEDEDIFVRERRRTKRTVILLVDVSGSMKGERIKTAAATVGALSAELHRDSLGVIAFWSDATTLLNPGEPIEPLGLLGSILRLKARGLTNIAFPLEIAAEKLARVPDREARVILLSDCVHNAGPDPIPIAAKLPRLDVLLDSSGEKDIWMGKQLARKGRGLCQVVRTHRDVPPAVTTLFDNL